MEVVGAIAFTAVFLALFDNLFDWFDGYYSLSLSCMFIALLFIALGFWSRARSLRLYGLALVIVCVLKLVTVDVTGLDTMMRVVAFIGGGLICLCISALYNFVAKRLDGGRSKAALERRPPQ
jgi:uncharacterized membrane protein